MNTRTSLQQRRGGYRAAFLAATLGLGASALVAAATTNDWTGASSTNWLTSGNWNPAAVPTSADTARFTGTPTANQPFITGGTNVAGLIFETSGWIISGTGNSLIPGANGILVSAADNGTNLISKAVTILGGATRTWLGTNGSVLQLSNNAALFTAPSATTTLQWGNGTYGGTLLLDGSFHNGSANIPFVINGGTLQVNNTKVSGQGFLNSRGVTVNGGAFLVTATPGDLIRHDGGNGSCALNGGMMNWNGFNETLYGLTLAGGTLRGSGSTLTLYNVSGANFSLNGNVTLGDAADGSPLTLNLAGANGTFTLSGTVQRTLTVNSTVELALRVANAITQPGWTKSGPGTLVLSGANTYTGVTTNSAGTLVLGSDTALGASLLVANGGALATANGTRMLTNVISLAADCAINTASGDLTLTGAITNSGGLTKNGTGLLALSGANAYAGNTILNEGTLKIKTSSQTPGAYSVQDGAAMEVMLSSAGTSVKPLSLSLGTSAGVTLSFDTANLPNPSVALLNVTNGTGALTVSAPVTVNVVAAGNGAFLSVGQFPLIKYTTKTGSGEFTLGSTPTAVEGYLSNNIVGKSIDFVITNKVVKTWVGNLDANWDSATSNWTLPGVGATNYVDGDNLLFDDTATNTAVNIVSPVYPVFVTVDNSAKNYSFGGSGIGGGSLTKKGTGTLSLNNDNSYAGTTTIEAGFLQVGAGATSGSLGSGEVVANGTLVMNRSDSLWLNNTISGSGTVAQTGSGGTVLYGSLTAFSGSLAVSNGTLQLSASAVTPPPPGPITLAGGSLVFDPSAPLSLANSLTLAGNASLGISGGQQATFTGALSAAGRTLTYDGPGTLYFNPASASLGSLSLAGGALGNTNGNLGGASAPITIANGAALWLNNGTTLPNSFVLNGGTGPDGNGILRNLGNSGCTLSGAVTLSGDSTIDTAGGDLTFFGAVTGTGGLTKVGGNTLTLSGTNTYASSTTVNAGTLALASASHANGAVTIADSAALAVSPAAPGQTLFLSSLTLGNSSLLFRNLSSTTVAALTVTNLTPNGSVMIPFTASPNLPVGQYPLIKYSGAIGGSGFPAFVLSYPRGLGVAELVDNSANHTVDLKIVSTNLNPVVWTAASSTNWDISATANWQTNGVATTYLEAAPPGDSVLFDDTAAGTGAGTVNITTAVSPLAVTVNNTNLNYTFSGNKISGATSLRKQGTGTLTMSTGTKNDFTGNVTGTGGTIIAGNGNSPFGVSNNLVAVSSGGVVDINTVNLTAYRFSISGTGVAGNGALVNNNPAQATLALRSLTLTADASVGGVGRWDLNPSVPGAGLVDLAGHTLTKVGGNQVSFFLSKITAGNMHVTGGTLAIRRGVVWTNSASQLVAETNTSLWIANDGALLNITVPIQLNGALITTGGNTVDSDLDSPITLVADSTLDAAIPYRQHGPLLGAAGFTKVGAGVLTLYGTNTYSGATRVNSGTLALVGNASIDNTETLAIAAGATFDISGLSSATFNLGSATTLSADGATNAATVKGSAGGVVNLGSRPVVLAYDGANPALTVSQGTLQLNGNAFTVNGTPLATGNYTLVQQITGNISAAGTFPVTGTTIDGFHAGAISVSGGQVLLTIWAAPAFPPNAVSVAGDGTVTLTATGTIGTPFTLWATTNVALTPVTNTWTKLTTGTVTTSPFIITDSGAATNQQRFYLFSMP